MRVAYEYLSTRRSWSENRLAADLDPSRPPEERAAFFGNFCDNYEALVRASPEGHGMDHAHCYLVAANSALSGRRELRRTGLSVPAPLIPNLLRDRANALKVRRSYAVFAGAPCGGRSAVGGSVATQGGHNEWSAVSF